MFQLPPLFSMIKEESGTDWEEMYRVFNMGHRMEIILPGAIADDVIQISEDFKVKAQIIGYIEHSKDNSVTIVTEHGSYRY